MKNIILDEYDLIRLNNILKSLDGAATVAEKTCLRILGESNPAYEFGFMNGYVKELGMEIKSILNKNK
jgi:Golgi nucleoside diphosphatase